MVQYEHPTVGGTLNALADPTRRAVLERLVAGSATISELAEPFGMSLTGMKKHVHVLERAQLVATEKVGRTRRCSIGPCGLDDLEAWIQGYQRMLEERLDRFGEMLERTKERSNDKRSAASNEGRRDDPDRSRDQDRTRLRRATRAGVLGDDRPGPHP